MSENEDRERIVLENLLPRYREEGFEVFVNPLPSILPSFMKSFRPDAVALKSDKKVAIEVVGTGGRDDDRDRIQQLQSMFGSHPDWEFRVFYVPRDPESVVLALTSREAIERSMIEIESLICLDHLLPALMLIWATLEGAARLLSPGLFSRPQSPARLVGVLAENGYLTPNEADAFRRAAKKRNAGVHGELTVELAAAELEELLAGLRGVTSLLADAAA